jgi:hypothetical protein
MLSPDSVAVTRVHRRRDRCLRLIRAAHWDAGARTRDAAAARKNADRPHVVGTREPVRLSRHDRLRFRTNERAERMDSGGIGTPLTS